MNALCMSRKQKIVLSLGPCNKNLVNFVCCFDSVYLASYPLLLLNKHVKYHVSSRLFQIELILPFITDFLAIVYTV